MEYLQAEIGILDPLEGWQLIDRRYVTLPANTVFEDEVNWLFDTGGMEHIAGGTLYVIPEPDELYTTNVETFSFVEDATPLTPANFSGGAPELTYSIPYYESTYLRLGSDNILRVSGMSETLSRVRRISDTNEHTSQITAEHFFGRFITTKSVEPFVGKLSAAFEYYCDVASITAPVEVEEDFDVILPGWYGNMWDHIKQLLIAYRLELSYEYPNIVIRKPIQRTIDSDYLGSIGTEIDNYDTSRYIEVIQYDNRAGDLLEFYPLANEEPQIFSVEAGATEEFEIQVNGWVNSLVQPVCVDWVDDASYEGEESVYSVSSSDDRLPVTAEQWVDNGGNIHVKMTDDPSIIKVVITGAQLSNLGPFEIAMSSGNFYNSLHIVGKGILHNQHTWTFPTGANEGDTSLDVGVTVDNPFISTATQVGDSASRAIANYTGPKQSISGLFALPPQGTSFGSLAGNRLRHRDMMYRIESTTFADGSVTFNGGAYAIVSDLDAINEGLTVDDWGAKIGVSTVQEYSINLLKGE